MAEFRLETDRLILREWRQADLSPLHAICTDPDVMRYLGPPQSREELAAALAPHRAWQADHGYCFWPIERRNDGQFLAFVA